MTVILLTKSQHVYISCLNCAYSIRSILEMNLATPDTKYAAASNPKKYICLSYLTNNCETNCYDTSYSIPRFSHNIYTRDRSPHVCLRACV